MKLIAITGGIGSGKSVVSHRVEVMGYQVYDCDSRAKLLMTQDNEVKGALTKAFGTQTYHDDGSINREHLSSMVFGDRTALTRLNAIVHPATARDMRRWATALANDGARAAFVETALLRTAGMDRMVDDVWHVTAPDETRVTRVMHRSGLTQAQVLDRMAAQRAEDLVAPDEHVIVNDNDTALLPQVMRLLNSNYDN